MAFQHSRRAVLEGTWEIKEETQTPFPEIKGISSEK